MRIRVVNPNTTASMTRAIGVAARAVAAPGTLIEPVEPTMGPASIESHYEEALAVPGLLEQIARGEQDGVDAFVVACFGDPGLDAARELATVPVIGIAEAGFHAAAMLGRRFGVVTTLARTTGRAHELAERYGFAPLVTEIRACEVPVLELDDPESGARALVIDECRAVIDGEPTPSCSGARAWPTSAPRSRWRSGHRSSTVSRRPRSWRSRSSGSGCPRASAASTPCRR